MKVLITTLISTVLSVCSLVAYAQTSTLTTSTAAPATSTTAKDITTPISDTALTAYLKTKLATSPTLASADVHVTTKNGRVFLSGTVPLIMMQVLLFSWFNLQKALKTLTVMN